MIKRITALVLAALMTVGAFIIIGAPPASAHPCANFTEAVQLRGLPIKLLSHAHRETGGTCSFAVPDNTRGEHSIGPMQINFAGGNGKVYRSWGYTPEAVKADQVLYWDLVVDLYNHCGEWPWVKLRRHGRAYYRCVPPSVKAIKLRDQYLISLAESASRAEAVDVGTAVTVSSGS